MAEVKGQAIERFLEKPSPDLPIILIHGPDRGRVSMRAKQLVQSLSGTDPDPMSLVDLDAHVLSDDPARLAEEADSVAMFGGHKTVVARIDDPKILLKPVDALLADPPSDSTVIIVAGDLKKSHPLRSRIERSDRGAAIACYSADRRDVAALLSSLVSDHGLTISREAQDDVLAMLGADHAMSQAEIEKLCLFARHDGAITADHVHAILVDGSAHAMSDVSDAAFAGRREAALEALARALAEGMEPSVITQMLLRHGQTLERLRIDVERGTSPDRAVASARPPIFFKRRAVMEQALRRWTLPSLRTCVSYLDEELVVTRLDQSLKATRLERQVLRVASEAARRTR
ncbi:MAG: DNA polymerase III subunit delta [Hyphomicrobiales bacterium]|jgi:DNA polymerase-3 subunit delta